MTAVLFVTNGHGEAAIAERIAAEVRSLDPAYVTDHLALVGERLGGERFRDVGPQRRMPSGGLVAMGNLRNLARDFGAGLATLVVRQISYLRRAGAAYRCIVAVGDAYALAIALTARRPTVFVGTAKSIYVAPYGSLERRILARARRIFVRDSSTAETLVAQHIPAEAPGNVIVDLLAEGPSFPWPWPERVALLPGSRPSAYDDVPLLVRIVRRAADARADLGAALSVAPQLEPDRFASIVQAGGWDVRPSREPFVPFEARLGERLVMRAWTGPLGSILRDATLAVGQAGTANEAAAGGGVPVVALAHGRRTGWYRMRQARLLGDAMAIFPDDDTAVDALLALLNDRGRLAEMGRVGRERMGSTGGAAAIAAGIIACA